MAASSSRAAAAQEPTAEELAVQAITPPAEPKTGKPLKTVWDKTAPNPNERKSIAEDPDGKANAKLKAKK